MHCDLLKKNNIFSFCTDSRKCVHVSSNVAIGRVGYQKKAANTECPRVAACSTPNNGHDTVNIVLWSERPAVCDVNNIL